MNIGSATYGLNSGYYQASSQANNAEGQAAEAAQNITAISGDKVSVEAGSTVAGVGKLLDILV